MALSEAIVNQAKEEARDFLEYSIYVLCTFLEVDIETVTSAIEIPVAEGDPDYYNYVSLKRQLSAFEALTS
jgi:hypothetical protein